MATFGRLGERFKQAVGLTGGNKEWKPTSNARNLQLLKDVRAFAQQLKLVLTEVKATQLKIDGTLTAYKTVLISPLPKAHDETPAGVVPVDNSEHAIGLNAMPDGLSAASTEMSTGLNARVIAPLEEWLNEYRKTKKMNERVEQLRLDLDTQRRNTAALQEKLAKLQATNHKDIETAKVKACTEADKLNRLADRYADSEAEVYASFLRLVRDSAVLRDIMAESIAIMQRSLTTAFSSFNVGVPYKMPEIPEPTKMSMLTYPGSEPATSAGGGAVPGGMTPEQAAALSAGGAHFPMPVKPGEAHGPGEAAPGGAPAYGQPPAPNSDAAHPPGVYPAPPAYSGMYSGDAAAAAGASAHAPPPAYATMHAGGGDGSVPPPAWQPIPEPVKYAAPELATGHADSIAAPTPALAPEAGPNGPSTPPQPAHPAA